MSSRSSSCSSLDEQMSLMLRITGTPLLTPEPPATPEPPSNEPEEDQVVPGPSTDEQLPEPQAPDAEDPAKPGPSTEPATSGTDATLGAAAAPLTVVPEEPVLNEAADDDVRFGYGSRYFWFLYNQKLHAISEATGMKPRLSIGFANGYLDSDDSDDRRNDNFYMPANDPDSRALDSDDDSAKEKSDDNTEKEDDSVTRRTRRDSSGSDGSSGYSP